MSCEADDPPNPELARPTPFRSIQCPCGRQVRFYDSTIDLMEHDRRTLHIRLPGTASDGHVALFRNGRLVGIECPLDDATHLSVAWRRFEV